MLLYVMFIIVNFIVLKYYLFFVIVVVRVRWWDEYLNGVLWHLNWN